MSAFDVVVWVCRGTPYANASYGTALSERLRAHGLRPHEVPYMERPLTAEERRCSRHLLSGGEVPVHSHEPMMARALDDLGPILERARADQARVIGTCLGMQMIAAALTSTDMVIEPEQPINVSMQRVDGHTNTLPRAMGMFHYHRVAADFAKTPVVDGCFTTQDNPVSGFTVGPNITGYQGHPELSPKHMRQLIAYNRSMIADHGADPDECLASVEHYADDWDVSVPDDLLTMPFLDFQRA